MFVRQLWDSPRKNTRHLVIHISSSISEYKQAEENSQRALSGNDEKESPEFKHAQLLTANIDSIKSILDNTIKELDKLTLHYLCQLKIEASAILENWPLEILEEIAIPEPPLVGLTVTVAKKTLVFDCQTLLQKTTPYFPQWLDESYKQIVLKKLNQVTAIYHLIHTPNKINAVKILMLQSYLEKVDVSRELREPSAAGVLPGDTAGSQYLKAIIHLNDNCCVAMENLCKHSNLATLQRQAIIRIEWLCLHYLNSLADKLLQLATQLRLSDIIALEEKSANIKTDSRFIYILREEAHLDKNKYKIHCSILLEAIDLFPSNEHYYIEKCYAALDLLQQIEEINPKFDRVKLNDFFALIESKQIKASLYRKSPSCLGSIGLGFFFSDHLVAATNEFVSNIKKIQTYYLQEMVNFPENSADPRDATLSPSMST